MRKSIDLFYTILVVIFFIPASAFAIPDLVIPSVEAPSTASIGSTISVTVEFKNEGTNLTEDFDVSCRVIVSADTDINLDDPYYITTTLPINYLTAGRSESITFTYTLPSELQGYYYVGAYIDDEFEHTETYETNNANYDPTPLFIGGTPPDTPANLSLSDVTGGFRISWNNVSGTSGINPYKIYWGNDASLSESNYAAIIEDNGTPSDHLGLTPGSTYYYRIQACSGTSCSPLSGLVSREYQVDPDPVLNIISPVAGATLYKGTDYRIKWTYSNYTGNILIHAYLDGVKLDPTIAANEPVTNGGVGVVFNPPQNDPNWPDSSLYEIRIATIDNQAPSSSGEFTITESMQAKPVWVPLYRLYNPTINDHYYTTIPAHRDDAVDVSGYTYEKIECYISDRPFDHPSAGPIYHLYHPGLNSHFYTADQTEKASRVAEGYNDEGVLGYLYTSPEGGMVPLAHLEHSSNTDNFYTVSKFEYDNAVQNLGFEYQGVTGWVSPTGFEQQEAHKRPQANFGGVDLGTGAYRGLNSLDLSMKGKGPDLSFKHYYNSFNFNRYPMGMGWSHNLYASIIEDLGGANQKVYVVWGDGSVSTFRKDESDPNNFIDETGNHDVLTFSDDPNYGYDLTKKDQTVYRFRKFKPDPRYSEEIVLLFVEDWKGNTLTYNYNQEYTTVSDEMGRSLRMHYSYPDRLLTDVDEIVDSVVKRTISFTYNTDNLLETYVNAKGGVTRYAYYDDSSTARYNLLRSITYPKGNTIEIDYYTDQTSSKAGRVKTINDDNAVGSTNIDYTPESNKTEVTDPDNNTFEYLHTNNMLSAFKGAGDPAWTTIERTDILNNPSRPTKVTDPLGNVTQYIYDARGNLTKVTNPEGRVSTFFYNESNNIEWSRTFHDPNNPPPTTSYSYDSVNGKIGIRLKTVTNPENETVIIGYNSDHQVQTVTNALGQPTTFGYDAYGNLNSSTDAEGNSTLFNNDYAGRTLSVTDGKGIKTSYTFDENNNPKDIRNHAQGTDSVIRKVSYLFDANDNLDTLSWYNEGTYSRTRYLYDDRDRLKSIIKPDGTDKTYTYYESGLIHERSDFNNRLTTYIYDDHKRLEKVNYGDNTSISTVRDRNGNVMSVTGAEGASSFIYDSLNRMKTYTDPYGQAVGYDYNPAGRISRIAYPGGISVEYEYDYAGRLETVYMSDGSTRTEVVRYIYDAAGYLREARRANGITTTYSYDLASRLTGISENDAGSTLWSYTYDLDGVGNHNSVEAVNEPLTYVPTAEEVTYSNDKSTNRLVSAGTATYTYDNNGNRTSKTDGGTTAIYSWNYENMLTRVESTGEETVDYAYDAMNNRIGKSVGDSETRYVLDLNSDMSRVLAETDGNGTLKSFYIYGHGLVCRIDASDSNQRFYHFNHRGDTVALTDESGAVTDSYGYDEYGLVQEDSGNSTDNPFKFVGRHGVMDEGNDIYFMRARYYDAEVGRFLSEDPLGFAGGDWNLSNYVGGNPLIKVDPSGASGSLISLFYWGYKQTDAFMDSAMYGIAGLQYGVYIEPETSVYEPLACAPYIGIPVSLYYDSKELIEKINTGEMTIEYGTLLVSKWMVELGLEFGGKDVEGIAKEFLEAAKIGWDEFMEWSIKYIDNE